MWQAEEIEEILVECAILVHEGFADLGMFFGMVEDMEMVRSVA
jgi:hypothetical protein